MPQLSIETWVSQYFWFLVILFIFHYFFVNSVVPTIATLIKIRKTLGKNSDDSIISNSNTNFDKEKLNLQFASYKTTNASICSEYRAIWLVKNDRKFY